MALFQLAIKNAYSKPGRFLLTSLAVLIGVALTTAVFVFTDSLRTTLGNLSEDIESGYDLAIRSEIPFGNRLDAAPISLDLPEGLSQISGVTGVQPRVIEFGIIPNKSAPFCSTCSRLRMTSDGKLIGCLSNPAPVSIRHLLNNADPEEIIQKLVRKSISFKQDAAFTGSSLVMSRVGG